MKYLALSFLIVLPVFGVGVVVGRDAFWQKAYADGASSCPAAPAPSATARRLRHFGSDVVIDLDQIIAYVHWDDTTQVYLDGCGSFIYVRESAEQLTKIINGEKP